MEIFTQYNIYRMDMDATKNKDIISCLKAQKNRDIEYSINEIIYNNDINVDKNKNKITEFNYLTDARMFFNKKIFQIEGSAASHEVMLTTYALIKETTYENITVKRLICMSDIDGHSIEKLRKIFKNYDEEANRKYYWRLRGYGWCGVKYLNKCLFSNEIMLAVKDKTDHFETEFSEKEYKELSEKYKFSSRAFEKEEIDNE